MGERLEFGIVLPAEGEQRCLGVVLEVTENTVSRTRDVSDTRRLPRRELPRVRPVRVYPHRFSVRFTSYAMTSVWSTMYSSLSCYRGGVLTVDVVKRVTCFQRQGTSKSFSFSWTPPVLGMFRGLSDHRCVMGIALEAKQCQRYFLSSMYGKKKFHLPTTWSHGSF